MHPSVTTKPRCTCSAFFESEGDLEKHLDETIEQRRFREQWIQWLQTEERRCRGHARISNEDSAHSDGEQSHDEYHEQETTITNQDRQSKKHLCPSCPRTTPFKTKQSLRRHYEQHVTCHEVCVCCTKVFRLVREFRRHAEKCTDESKRKMAYMRQTCDELREFAEGQLETALSKTVQNTTKSKKRAWHEADIDTESSDAVTKVVKPDFGGCVTSQPRQAAAHEMLHNRETEMPSSYPPSTNTAPYLPRDLGRLICSDSVPSQYQARQLSTDRPGEQIPPLDLIDEFDAPLMHIMNGVPVLMNQWDAPGIDTIIYPS